MAFPVSFIPFFIYSLWTWIWGKPKDESPSEPKSETHTRQTPQEDPQARHLRKTMEFAKSQHKTLTHTHREQAAWQRRFGAEMAGKLHHLGGTEFEEFLAGLFRGLGYAVELTATTGDYGADLILTKDRRRIAVQAKRYRGSVGVFAVQEALSGQAYYRCDAAWVITTGTFTPNALELADKSGVKMLGRSELGNLMAQHNQKTGHDRP